ncbi:MAG: antibiotic biosynthesis monooxygenase [Actinomycetota bacterium]|nr:antibiotic biosynthesis monooxygenase [Actinomycetota bacterium]
MPYAVIARYEVAPTDASHVREALIKMREHAHTEPANLTYEVHEVLDAPEGRVAFVLYEVYDDQAGFEAHTRTEHFTRLIVADVRPRLLDRSVTFANLL